MLRGAPRRGSAASCTCSRQPLAVSASHAPMGTLPVPQAGQRASGCLASAHLPAAHPTALHGPHLLCHPRSPIKRSLQRLLAASGHGGVWRSRGGAAKCQAGDQGEGGGGGGGRLLRHARRQRGLAAGGCTLCRAAAAWTAAQHQVWGVLHAETLGAGELGQQELHEGDGYADINRAGRMLQGAAAARSPSSGSRPGDSATSTQSPPGATAVSAGGSSAPRRRSVRAEVAGDSSAAAPASASSRPGCSARKACRL